jgi:PAS domain S-box-containing protein
MPFSREINLQHILNQITDSLIVVDLEGRIVYYNDVAQSYRDMFPSALEVGVIVYQLIPLHLQEVIRDIIQRTATDRSPQFGQFEIKHPTGHMLYFDVRYAPVIDENENVDMVCIMSRDVTVQKNIERKNNLLVRELSNLIERANAVIFSADSQGYVTEWNSEAEKVSGYNKEDVLGTQPNFLLNGEKGTFQQVLVKVLSGEVIANQELFFRRADAVVTVLINGTPKKNVEGKVIGALFIGQDVTELMEYRTSLEKQVKDRTMKLKEALEKEKALVEMKNKFVSIVSHEFKLPLSAIGNSVDVLKRDVPIDNRHLESITQHVNNMKALLEDVLSIERHEGVKLRPNLKMVDLKLFLSEIIEEVSGATNRTHRVNTTFPDQPVLLESDQKLLRNIFINLLTNAIKFSPNHSEVDLSLGVRNGIVSVSVKDFGLGIEQGDLEKLFQPFSRGSNTGNISGTGLGLSIVKRAVVALKGEIAVDSQPGAGTTFTIEIPLEPGE